MARLERWHGYAVSDLRKLLPTGDRRGWSRVYCGRGSKRRCRGALQASLKAAAGIPASETYANDDVCKAAGRAGEQACFDSVFFRPIGGVTQPLIPWQNRPTFQQVVEVGAR